MFYVSDIDSECYTCPQETGKQPASSVKVQQQQQARSILPSRQLPAAQLPTTRVVRTDQDEHMSDDDKFEDAVGMATSDKPHPLPVSQQLAATMGVRAHRVQVMKASFFGDEESLKQCLTSPQLGRQGLLKGSKRTNPLVQTAPLAQQTMKIGHTPSTSALQAQSAALLAKHDLQTLVPYTDSLMKGRERHIADLGLFMGRSFRVGWGPHWTLSHSGDQLSHSQVKSRGLFHGFGSSVSESSGVPVRVVLERVAVVPAAPDSCVSVCVCVDCCFSI